MRRYLQATEFTNYRVSHSLAANLEGHPATIAASSQPAHSNASDQSPEDIGIQGTLDPSLSKQLIAAYFDCVHPNFPVLHRGVFQVRFDKTHDTDVYDPGWMGTLYMVYTLGAQAIECELPQARRLQEHYLSLVIPEGLGRMILSSTLSSIQALLLLALYQHNAGERDNSWRLTGHAVRTAVATGLHRDGEKSNMDLFDRNSRRVLWWTLHLFEQYLSLALGRPSFTDAIVSRVEYPDAPFEMGLGLPREYLAHSVSLASYITRVKQTVAMASAAYKDIDRLLELHPTVVKLHIGLIAWKKGLPAHLGLGQPTESLTHRRLILNLLISADYLESILCRPYLLCRTHYELQGSDIPEEIAEIAGLSVDAAHASAIKVGILDRHHLVDGTLWLDFYAIQHAIMVTSLQYLGRPHDPNGAHLREPIINLLAIAQRTHLAPTYRLTMAVARQLAVITGLVVDTTSSAMGTSPNGGNQSLLQSAYMSQFDTRSGMIDTGRDNITPSAVHMDQPNEDIFSEFLSMNNDATQTNLFDDWNFFGAMHT
jgi:proline utilization trans-activator